MKTPIYKEVKKQKQKQNKKKGRGKRNLVLRDVDFLFDKLTDSHSNTFYNSLLSFNITYLLRDTCWVYNERWFYEDSIRISTVDWKISLKIRAIFLITTQK